MTKLDEEFCLFIILMISCCKVDNWEIMSWNYPKQYETLNYGWTTSKHLNATCNLSSLNEWNFDVLWLNTSPKTCKFFSTVMYSKGAIKYNVFITYRGHSESTPYILSSHAVLGSYWSTCDRISLLRRFHQQNFPSRTR